MTSKKTFGFRSRPRQRLGIKQYPSFGSMPVSLRFCFMALFGLESALIALQLKRVIPLATSIMGHFNDWHRLAHATVGEFAMIGLLLTYVALLLLMGWISRSVFQTCRKSLERELFQ